MWSEHINRIENKEMIEILRKKGFEQFVDKMLDMENSIYTRKGRLNRSACSRILGISMKDLKELLNEARKALGKD
jgi:hypothetical protein